MKRPNLPLATAFAVLAGAARVAAPAAAGEPGPGLEIINADGTVQAAPAPQPAYAPPLPAYAPPPAPAPRPYPTTPIGIPTGQAAPAPYPSGEPYPAADSYGGTPRGRGEPRAGAAAIPGPELPPAGAVLAALNGDNRYYPGLAAAKAQGDVRQAAAVIWRTLRERRIVYTALQKGPGFSRGVAAPDEMRRLYDILDPGDIESGRAAEPRSALRRIDAIIDTFERPVIEDANYGGVMDRLLARLHADMTAVRAAMGATEDDALYYEMSRAFIRGAIVCDFFTFPRRELATDVNTIMEDAKTLFHPDGSSVAGDVGGVSGSVFHELLLVDAVARNDATFDRAVARVWETLGEPARYLISLALPDKTTPRFGPRGLRELAPTDIAKLEEIFPGRPRTRGGMTETHSFPARSGDASYGGIYATRSGPAAGARYLATRLAPPGNLRGAPPHHDFGSIVAATGNVTFVVDGGGFGGVAAEARAHNVLALDGAYAAPYPPAAGGPLEAEWRTNAGIDYAAGEAAFSDGKRWRRQVLYVKELPGEAEGDYWLLLDRVAMNGDNRPRQARIRFQLAPGIQVYHDGAGMLAAASFGQGSALRIFAVDANAELTVTEGEMVPEPGYADDSAGSPLPAPAITLDRTLVGDSVTATLLYPSFDQTRRPLRIDRDSDIVRGRTGAIVVDHGNDRVDVIAWTEPGTELVTPTLNLRLAADVAVFRLRKGRIVRAAFVNLRRFHAKEPDGGEWSLRVRGPAATLFLEPERGGGWQVLADGANPGAVTLEGVNFGPAITDRRFAIRPGEIKIVPR